MWLGPGLPNTAPDSYCVIHGYIKNKRKQKKLVHYLTEIQNILS